MVSKANDHKGEKIKKIPHKFELLCLKLYMVRCHDLQTKDNFC
jgi:hypothetical protein